MNNKILQKCIDELNKEKFSKEYVLGMLETLIELNQTTLPTNNISNNYVQPTQTTIKQDVKQIEKTEEELYAEKMLGGRIADTSLDTIISLN